MPIVNLTNYPYIYSTEEITKVEYKTESGGYWTVRDWEDNNYWYCAVFHGGGLDSVDFTTLIPNEIINDTSTYIVLCMEHEGYTNVVEPIYRNLIQKLKIDPKKIILISENADACRVVVEIAEKYKLDTINVEWSTVFERGTIVQHALIGNNINRTTILEKKEYSKHFLNFNGRWRSHRPCFVALLYCMNLIDKGFVSLGKADDNLNWNDTFDVFLKLVEEDKELYSLLVNNKNNILNLPELYLDTTNLIINRNYITHSDINHADTMKLYEDSYFSVVSETNFFGNTGRFLTEKTFKPIAYTHPFILLCDPYSLKLLKQLGYKTFHPFINESYDNEPNDTKRMKIILNEVNRLSNLSKSELFEFIDNIKEITNHNYNVLVNKQKFTHCHKML